MEQQFLYFFNTPSLSSAAGFPRILAMFLNDHELFVVTMSGFPLSFTEDSSI